MRTTAEVPPLAYEFGEFVVDRRKRQLTRAGQPVGLGAKAFDLLLVLVQHSGQELTKEELLEKVWPGQFVEEANLPVHIAALRKALGENKDGPQYIVTLPRRGYQFVAETSARGAEHDNGSGPSATSAEPVDSTIQRPEAVRSRHRVRLVAITAAIALAAAAGLFALRDRASTGNDPIPFAQSTQKQLTTKGRVRWMAVSPDARFFAYVFRERGEFVESLWLAQTDSGSDIRLLPPTEGIYNGIGFAPDGKSIYFMFDGPGRAHSGLFRVPALGGVPEKVSDVLAGAFNLSPDGRQVALARTPPDGQTSVLAVVGVDGANERELAVRPLDRRFLAPIAWSPDGQLLAATAISDAATEGRDVFVVRRSDGHIEQLSKEAWNIVSNVAWLPSDGGLIVVAAGRGELDRRLWHVDYPSGHAQPLSRDTDTYGAGLSVSPDGRTLLASQLRRESNVWVAPAEDLRAARQVTFSSLNGMDGWRGMTWAPGPRIIFAAAIDHTSALFSIDPDGGHRQQITSSGFHDQRPSVTADGRLIVFQSNRSGTSEIWRVNVNGSDVRQVTQGGSNSSPQVTPDGGTIVYVSAQDGTARLWRTSIDGGAPVRLTEHGCAFPNMSPDGALVACGIENTLGRGLQLAIVRLADAATISRFEVPGTITFFDGINWMPDGGTVAYHDAANGIWTQKLTGGPPERIAGLPQEKIYTFGWSRDGTLFAFTRGREIGDAVLLRDSAGQ